jgi:hypothetical protein
MDHGSVNTVPVTASSVKASAYRQGKGGDERSSLTGSERSDTETLINTNPQSYA